MNRVKEFFAAAEARLRAKLAYWGTRLNLLASLLVGYMAANGAAIQNAVNSVVPEAWRPLAQVGVGIVTFLIVNAAANSDAKKVAGQWQR